MPDISQASIKLICRPRYSTKLVLLRFLACCFLVAQEQFSEEYGPLLFLRSMECFEDGLSPISL